MKNIKINFIQLCTEFELTVELLPVPAKRVDANGEFSTGRLHASIDHGALSYILNWLKKHREKTEQKKRNKRE